MAVNGRLADKVVIVTGAAGDVGSQIVRRSIEEGASVVATDLDLDRLEAMRGALASPERVVAERHDIASEADWGRVVETAVVRFGGVNALVNCAGYFVVKMIEDMSLAEWQRVMNINCDAAFLGMKATLPELKKAAAKNGAAIVNVASAQGLMAGQPGLAAYSASKGGMRLLTRTAAVEFGRLGYNIRCNCVIPSAMGGTAMMNRQISLQVERGVFADMDAGMKAINAVFPLGHTATPLDVAEAVIFLASEQAKNITGIDLPVDGGRCA
jgi:NAD(P)-dependent dehydrogenase (short-subunit alcohol dehydrogenase family)